MEKIQELTEKIYREGVEKGKAEADRIVQEATDKARRMPSVKHTRGILAGKEISEAEYYEFRSVSAYERRPQGSWGR